MTIPTDGAVNFKIASTVSDYWQRNPLTSKFGNFAFFNRLSKISYSFFLVPLCPGIIIFFRWHLAGSCLRCHKMAVTGSDYSQDKLPSPVKTNKCFFHNLWLWFSIINIQTSRKCLLYFPIGYKPLQKSLWLKLHYFKNMSVPLH